MRKMDKRIDDFIKQELKQTVKNMEPSQQLFFNIKNKIKLQEENSMKKNLFASKKLKAAVVVGALCVMSFTCYAAMKISGYTSHSYREWDNLPTAEEVQKKVDFTPKFIEEFSNGFVFKDASVGAMSGTDSEFNKVTAEHKIVTFDYKRGEEIIAITNRQVSDEIGDDYSGFDETVDLDGIEGHYNKQAYKFFPPDVTPSDEDIEAQKAGALEISYGSSEIEEMNIQSLFWEEDGIVYEMTALGADIDKEGLIEMAKEVIAK
ncbi:hypothetical protein [Clostridium sp. MD294]|uniref:hypothetical protein n=1 Tax=Clostridium sp. MD294 TaxID=97138 RepID=UPI0002CB0D4F|nr:hypothetical protein [Clostridium sp. MD294]NDO47510.1 hypothetical protein [Clostridium sp. MD294]USF29418.1 hypothetical protein C820_000809 [Clostridium sp. MD294]